MKVPDTERSESVFPDKKPPLTALQASVEANRCLYCVDAPCVKACPTGIDIPEFIRKIATENVRGSAKTILDSNILGQSCARVCPVEVLCVGDCVYNTMGVPPIQIGKLQRFSTDTAAEKGWQFYSAGVDSGKSVGLIGGGPASLAAAHRLRRFGHAVTIYEARDVLGGLNTTGIAPYKLRADESIAEVERVLAIGGIEVETGVSVPRDVSWDELRQRHDALFVGLGLGPDTLLEGTAGMDGAPGNVEGAVAWIEKMKLGKVPTPQHAVVIGGGNTAIDAVRELAGLGVPSVEMVYRGTEDGMSGYAHEWKYARQEGVAVRWQTQPLGFAGNGVVTGVNCVKVDAAKRPIAGTEHVVPADLVLLAIGQAKLGDLVAGLGIEVQKGRIVTGPSGSTSNPRVFAGGDCANGGKEVVNGVAEGRDAAIAIDALLRGGK